MFNLKNFSIALLIVGVFFIGTKALPVSALTVEDLQAQVKELLAKITELTKQIDVLKSQQATSTPSSEMPFKHRVCIALYRNLRIGAYGDDVRSMQEFLAAQGYLNADATGYYGPVTANAVAKWQNAEGVSAVGSFGPLSRERIKIWCGGWGSLEAYPTSGNAPLTVYFWHVIGGDSADGYSIDFGDGTTGELSIGCGVNPMSGVAACPRAVTASHTYSANGTYVTRLTKTEYACELQSYPSRPGCPQQKVIGTAEIHVGIVACTMEYNPVCGAKPIVCITTPCNPVSTTYGNRCAMNADGATFLYKGECRVDYTNPADDPQCKSWNDGCNICTRQYPGGPAMCTLRACAVPTQVSGSGTVTAGSSSQSTTNTTAIASMPRPYYGYCTAYFDNSGNRPPTISSFSGPTRLSVNETGTWTINASDPENGQLSYSVTWGDENAYVQGYGIAASAMREFTQTTTFTHSYAYAGTYTVTIVVQDSSGKSAKSSATVNVGNYGTCTGNYQPVCGQPPMSCPQGMYCAMIMPAPRTYSNRCEMNAAGATFISEGVCPNPYGGGGTLSGTESIGPICPVETYPPQPECRPTAATYAAHRIFVYTSNGDTLVNTITADINGNYSISLNPGDYKVRVENAGNCTPPTDTYSSTLNYRCSGMSSAASWIPIHISASVQTTLNINIDTGIR